MFGKLNLTNLNMNTVIRNAKITPCNGGSGTFTESHKNHCHSFYELHVIVSGHGQLKCEGETVDLTSGVVFITGPKIFHEQITDKNDPMFEYFFAFEVSPNTRSVTTDVNRMFDTLTFWHGHDTHNMLDSFHQLDYEGENLDLEHRTMVESIISQLMIKLIREMHIDNKHGVIDTKTPDDKRRITADYAFLDNSRTITLKELANRLSLSERQTSRFVIAQYGETFSALKTRYRLNEAAFMLITQPDRKISDIADDIGYGLTYFEIIFEKQFGVSPREYRKKQLSI